MDRRLLCNVQQFMSMTLCNHTMGADCCTVLVPHTAGPPAAMRGYSSHFESMSTVNFPCKAAAPLIGRPNGCVTPGWDP